MKNDPPPVLEYGPDCHIGNTRNFRGRFIELLRFAKTELEVVDAAERAHRETLYQR